MIPDAKFRNWVIKKGLYKGKLIEHYKYLNGLVTNQIS